MWLKTSPVEKLLNFPAAAAWRGWGLPGAWPECPGVTASVISPIKFRSLVKSLPRPPPPAPTRLCCHRLTSVGLGVNPPLRL